MGPCAKSGHGSDPAGAFDIHPVCRSVRALMRQAVIKLLDPSTHMASKTDGSRERRRNGLGFD